MRITKFGHACVRVEYAGTTLVIDPGVFTQPEALTGADAVLITHEVEEALVLADRVLVLEEGRISLEIAVDLPRPRDRGAAGFAALKSRILSRILGEGPATRTPADASLETHPVREEKRLAYAG